MRTQIGQKLEEGGERERLKELLRIRLKECGWRDQLKEHCRGVYGHIILGVQSTKVTKKMYTHTHTRAEVIGQKGLSNVTVDMLVQEITPKARSKYQSYPLFNI